MIQNLTVRPQHIYALSRYQKGLFYLLYWKLYHLLVFGLSKISFRGPSSKVVSLVANGKLNLSDSITERFPLEEVNKGLDHLYKKIGNPIRIVIELD
jgi:hypothetical protein